MWILLLHEVVNSWSHQASCSVCRENWQCNAGGYRHFLDGPAQIQRPHCLLNTKVHRSYHFLSHLLCLHLGGSIYCVPGTIISSLLTCSPWLFFSCSVVSGSLRPHGLLARQAPLFMEFSRQDFWTRLPLPSPEDLPNPGIKPTSPALQAVSCVTGGFFLTEPLYVPKNDR